MADFTLNSVVKQINSDIRCIMKGQLTEDDFLSTATLTNKEIQRHQLFRVMCDQAVLLKRQGDLKGANDIYLNTLSVVPKFDSQWIWGWTKIFLLAKKWKESKKLLEYYQRMMVMWYRIQKENGNTEYFNGLKMLGIEPSFDFDYDPGITIRDVMGHPMMDRNSARNKIASYGGSPYWENNFTLSNDEFEEFLKWFPIPSV